MWGPSLWSQPQGKFWIINDLQESPFQQCVSLKTQYAVKAVFLQGGKGINRECVFRSLSIRDFLDAIMWDLHVCPVDLTSRVRGQFVSRTFWASLTHSYGVPELPMRKQVAEVCLRVLVAILWLPWWSDIQLYIGQRLVIASSLLAFEIPKGGPKLSVSEETAIG